MPACSPYCNCRRTTQSGQLWWSVGPVRSPFGPRPPVARRCHPVPGLSGCAMPSARATAPKRPKMAVLDHITVGPSRKAVPEARPGYYSVSRGAPVQSPNDIARLLCGVVLFLSEVRSPFRAIQDQICPTLCSNAHAALLIMTFSLEINRLYQAENSTHADGLYPQPIQANGLWCRCVENFCLSFFFCCT